MSELRQLLLEERRLLREGSVDEAIALATSKIEPASIPPHALPEIAQILRENGRLYRAISEGLKSALDEIVQIQSGANTQIYDERGRVKRLGTRQYCDKSI